MAVPLAAAAAGRAAPTGPVGLGAGTSWVHIGLATQHSGRLKLPALQHIICRPPALPPIQQAQLLRLAADQHVARNMCEHPTQLTCSTTPPAHLQCTIQQAQLLDFAAQQQVGK